jgi:hypothetical protein
MNLCSSEAGLSPECGLRARQGLLQGLDSDIQIQHLHTSQRCGFFRILIRIRILLFSWFRIRIDPDPDPYPDPDPVSDPT